MGRVFGIYALYKGEKFLCEGTKEEISKKMNVSTKTLDYYRTKHWIVNRRSRSGVNNRRILIKLNGNDKFTELQ